MKYLHHARQGYFDIYNDRELVVDIWDYEIPTGQVRKLEAENKEEQKTGKNKELGDMKTRLTKKLLLFSKKIQKMLTQSRWMKVDLISSPTYTPKLATTERHILINCKKAASNMIRSMVKSEIIKKITWWMKYSSQASFLKKPNGVFLCLVMEYHGINHLIDRVVWPFNPPPQSNLLLTQKANISVH